jgi:phosphotransferase system enzyme I (PtsI)
MMLCGIAVSPGIAIGKAFIFAKQKLTVDMNPVPESMIPDQQEKAREASKVLKNRLQGFIAAAEKSLDVEKTQILTSHMMMSEDPAFLKKIAEKIASERMSAGYAVRLVTDEYASKLELSGDEYLKERAADIRDIGDGLIRIILNVKDDGFDEIEGGVILVALNLEPSDTVKISAEKVCGIVTEIGSRTSHTAILARAMGIPAVVGVSGIVAGVKNGELLCVDGNNGAVAVDPTPNELNTFESAAERYRAGTIEMVNLKSLPATTKDGKKTIVLAANIGALTDCETAKECGAEGVGLFRTEFLYMGRDDLPDEEEQFFAYRKVAELFAPHPVVIRTLDIGGDKRIPYFGIPSEMNPFLGWRAIRYCLDNPHILKTQLKAILRASPFGNVKIMYPMISSTIEVDRANGIFARAKEELECAGIRYDNDIKIGVMIETPAAAMISDLLAEKVSFFSIGTNDLIQYTLAADRMNSMVSSLYDPLHPAVLRLIELIVKNAHTAGICIGVCGEMAGEPETAKILIGLGADELSMSSPSILRVKKAIRDATLEELRKVKISNFEPKE